MELKYIFNDEEYTYIPSVWQINDAIYKAFSDDYRLDYFQTKQIIEDFDLSDKLIEAYKDYIKDTCERFAHEEYLDSKKSKRY